MMRKNMLDEEEKGYIEAYLGGKDGGALIRMNEGNTPPFSLSAFLFTFIAFSRKKMQREACVCFALMLVLPLAAGIFAGTAAMLKGGMEITPGAVYSELRRIPVTVEHSKCRCHGTDIALLSRYVPWYLLMLDPLIHAADYDFAISSVPAFYFGLFRTISVLAVSAVCGACFYRLYLSHTRRTVLSELTKIPTDNKESRRAVLAKVGAESGEKGKMTAIAVILWSAVTILPIFNDAVCIIYNY